MIKKIVSFCREQNGLSMVGLLMALAVTGVIAIGATVASVQLLRTPEGVRIQAGNVVTQLGQILQGLQQAPGARLMRLTIIKHGIIALDGDIDLDSNTLVRAEPDVVGEGDIWADGNIALDSNAWVKGDATATGTITTLSVSRIDGTKTPNFSPPLTFNQPDTQIYLQQARSGGTTGSLSINVTGIYNLGPKHITGNLTITGDGKVVLQGTVWVDGVISIDNTRIEGSGTVVAVGNISQSNNSVYQPSNIRLLMSTNGSIFSGGNGRTAAILYAPNGAITIDSNREIYGSVIGQNIRANSNAIITYPTSQRLILR